MEYEIGYDDGYESGVEDGYSDGRSHGVNEERARIILILNNQLSNDGDIAEIVLGKLLEEINI